MTCAHCEEMKAEIEYLRSELGLSMAAHRVQKIRDLLPQGSSRGVIAKLLICLYQAKGKPLTRGQIFDAVPPYSGEDDDRGYNYISMLVCKAREHVGFDSIKTIWGGGYALTPKGMAWVARAVGDEP